MHLDKNIVRNILSFSMATSFGAISTALSSLFYSIMLNNFFSASLNAARSISEQITAGSSSLGRNMLKATEPAIVKSWASGDRETSRNLTLQVSRFAAYMGLLLILPLWFELSNILRIWLENIPNYTLIFSKIFLIQVIFVILSHPLTILINAYGKILFYQIILSFIILCPIPLVYIAFKLGAQPQVSSYIFLFCSILCFLIRLLIVSMTTKLRLNKYIYEVLFPVGKVVILPLIALLFLSHFSIDNPYISIVFTILVSSVILGFSIYFFGLLEDEKNTFLGIARKYLNLLRKGFIL